MTTNSEGITEPDIVEKTASRARFALGVVAVALGASAFAVGFRLALSWLLHVTYGANDVVSAMRAAPLPLRLLSPACGALIAGLIGLLLARWKAGAGVGDVMEAVVLGRVRLSLGITALKSLASFAAIAAGGSIGREGPLIQFGGATGSAVAARLRLENDDARVLIAAGTAAGFAAAYNTPFAAVLFVLEVVTGVVVLDAILPALIAVVIATTLTRIVVGEGPIYGQRAFHLTSAPELLAFLGLGIVTAFGAQGFMRLLSKAEDVFQRVPLPWRPALGGGAAGVVVLFMPEVAGNGYEPLDALLDGRLTVPFALFLLVGKTLATTASVSSGSPGGVFTPSLLIGGCIGFLYGAALAALGADVDPAGYALVGMAAATAATTHAPLMAAVMAFELSGDYAIAMPLLLATAMATLVSRRLRRESVYAAERKRRGVAWELTMEGRRVVDAGPKGAPQSPEPTAPHGSSPPPQAPEERGL